MPQWCCLGLGGPGVEPRAMALAQALSRDGPAHLGCSYSYIYIQLQSPSAATLSLSSALSQFCSYLTITDLHPTSAAWAGSSKLCKLVNGRLNLNSK